MARTKGSKNKKAATNFEEALAAKLADKAGLEAEIAQTEKTISEQRQLLKSKKAQLKAIDKAIAALEAKRAKQAAAAAEKEKRAELDKVLDDLISDGASVEDILKKLK